MPLARRRITTTCAALRAPALCTAMVYAPGGRESPPDHWWQRQPEEQPDPSVGSRSLARALELKRRSVFCLEPPGANPIRRSMYDSLLSGCIPVLFMSAAAFERFLPRAPYRTERPACGSAVLRRF